MSEMVERVAKAIESASQPPGQKDYKILMKNCARAAIEAMREPTAEMCQASLKQDYAEADKFGSYAGPIERWKAMINEALK